MIFMLNLLHVACKSNFFCVNTFKSFDLHICFDFVAYIGAAGNNDIVKDVVLWRRKKLSALVLVAATATWMLMQVFQFNFLTIISWLAIFLVASVFLYANLCRLLGR